MTSRDRNSTTKPPRRARTARTGAPQALPALVRRLTKPLFGKRGMADGRIVGEWAEIVGPLLAKSSLPQRIVHPRGERIGGTLHLKVAPGGLATELQHLEPLLIERINGHFGYRAVARLALVQAPLPPPAPPPAPRPQPDAQAEDHLRKILKEIGDPLLRGRLEALGRAILARPVHPNPGGTGPKKA